MEIMLINAMKSKETNKDNGEILEIVSELKKMIENLEKRIK